MKLAALWVGVLGSLGFTLYTGRHNPSILLIGLFLIWVASPFVVMIARSRRHSLAIIVTLSIASLAIYGTVALGPPRAQPAFFFLMTPAATWLLLLVQTLRRDR